MSKDYVLFAGKIKFDGNLLIVDASAGNWENYMTIMAKDDSKTDYPYPAPETEKALFALEEGRQVEVIARVL